MTALFASIVSLLNEVVSSTEVSVRCYVPIGNMSDEWEASCQEYRRNC
jgi:hypothetical protein